MVLPRRIRDERSWVLVAWLLVNNGALSRSVSRFTIAARRTVAPALEPRDVVVLPFVFVTRRANYFHSKEKDRNTQGSCRAELDNWNIS